MISNPSPAAVFSADGTHRYFLSRNWSVEGLDIAFVGLNPSTADAENDDPTIRRCVSFAKAWGGRSLWMVNLFAFRSTNPAQLKTAADPVGAANDAWLDAVSEQADIVVAAWGNHGNLSNRAEVVKKKFGARLKALRITNQGMPGHPLYIPRSVSLVPFV